MSSSSLGPLPPHLEQAARAEPDDVSGEVADGPDQAPAESVVDATVALGDQSAGEELSVRESLLPQMRGERVPGLRREAQPEVVGDRGIESSFGEEGARRGRLG